jgi:hypothetical protein
MNIFYDFKIDEAVRRAELYRGSVFLYSPSPAAMKLCEFARELIEAAFVPDDPRTVHKSLPVERCVEILAELKPKFIHHPRSKELIQELLAERGCDLEKTYFDVPRLRTAYPSNYLASGIAYAFHPHRDTWYSAPFSQINWWMPVYQLNSENCMAFHPRYWSVPVKNGSSQYNYDRWNRESRRNAAQHIKADTRVQPKPEEPIEMDPQYRPVCDVGGVFLFSGAQLHSTVPNTSDEARYSIDFRTVHLDDIWAETGAPNIDSACTGTTMRDYLRAKDFAHIPEEAIALYDDAVVSQLS